MAKRIIFMLGGLMVMLSACSTHDPEPLPAFSFTINNWPVIEWGGPTKTNSVCLLCGSRMNKSPTHFSLSSSAPGDYGRALNLASNSPELNIATWTETVEHRRKGTTLRLYNLHESYSWSLYRNWGFCQRYLHKVTGRQV